MIGERGVMCGVETHNICPLRPCVKNNIYTANGALCGPCASALLSNGVAVIEQYALLMSLERTASPRRQKNPLAASLHVKGIVPGDA